jgi:hypothetical protein
MRGTRFVGMAALAAVIAGCASKAPEELAKAPPPPPGVVGPRPLLRPRLRRLPRLHPKQRMTQRQ